MFSGQRDGAEHQQLLSKVLHMHGRISANNSTEESLTLTWTMSNDQPVLTSLTESSTDVPVSAGQVENYVLLLVLLSVFAGGTLVLLSLLLLFCHRCCMGGRRYSRASDDPEKTNTTYAEDSQPTQEITIRLDESDALSASSCHDGESDRFVSTGATGRRVSFNESALYEQEKTTQDKGRRYTLTEGDFHHLKKARLTHLHLPPAPCDLKILTIMECDSAESSTLNISEAPPPKLPLTIYQPPERRLPDWTGPSLSGGLPGDPHHSVVLDQRPRESSLTTMAQHTRSQTMETIGDRGGGAEGGERTLRGDSAQTSVLHFFSKLRRHASLEGAGPYFKRWKFDTSHRAASLDAKGSPRRKPFQRQRAASETTEHTEDDSPSLRDDAFESFPQTPVATAGLQALSAESLSRPVVTATVLLSRPKPEAEVGGGGSGWGEGLRLPSDGCPPQRQEEVTVNGTALEKETAFGAGLASEAAVVAADRPERAEDDEPLGVWRDGAVARRADDPKTGAGTEDGAEADDGEEVTLGAEARRRTDSGSSLSFLIRQESLEAPPSLYRDIWSLRASLEQYASSDQSSTDRESVRSDADSVSSVGGAGARSGLDSCLSQDLDDEPDEDGDTEGARGASGTDGEAGAGGGAGGEAEGGNRKLLQMDSGYASIEAPSRAPEDTRLFGAPGGPRGKTASERRLFFTSAGRKGSVCESVDARLFQEELEDQMSDGTETETHAPGPAPPPPPPRPLKPSEPPSPPVSPLAKAAAPPPPAGAHRPRLRRRDYSIDEKTDALFSEFLRHDPRFDQPDSPLRCRHRSRVHLRKQWQRHKQYSDPGAGSGGRYSPSLERQRFTPLRRGDSAGYPLDTRYHSTLSRIASAADEEASEVAAAAAAEGVVEEPVRDGGGGEGASSKEEPESTSVPRGGAARGHMDPRVDNRNNNSSQAVQSEASPPPPPPPGATLTDKLAASVEERLYGGLRGADAERTLTVSSTAAPGFSPI